METEKTLRKGRDGEIYIVEKLKTLGFRVFYPEDRFSFSDRILLSPDGRFYFAQLKHKNPRYKRHDTGMSVRQYNKYLEEQKRYFVKMIVFFTDDTGSIYGEWLDNLESCNPVVDFNRKDNYNMIFWLVDKLKDYKELFKC